MKSSDTLSSPTKMWDLAEAATKALTVDTGIGKISRLRDLGLELGEGQPEEHHLRHGAGGRQHGRRATVLLNESKAKPLFSMIQNDTSLTEVKQKEQDAKDKQADAAQGAQGGAPPRSASPSSTAATRRGRRWRP